MRNLFGKKDAARGKPGNKPVHPVFMKFRSELDSPGTESTFLSGAEIMPWAVPLLRLRLTQTSSKAVSSALRAAWDVLASRHAGSNVKGYREVPTDLPMSSLSVNPLVLSTFSYDENHGSRVQGNMQLIDDVLFIWPQLAQAADETLVLTIHAVVVDPKGPFDITPNYLARGPVAGQMQDFWDKLSSGLRQVAGTVPLCDGFFPDQYFPIPRVQALDTSSNATETFGWLLSQYGVSTHEGTVIRYSTTGHSVNRFVLESVGKMRTGEQKQFHSGTIVIDAANVAHAAAVRWTTDFGLLISFRSPVPFIATNHHYPSWHEERVNLTIYDQVIKCDSMEDAVALHQGFDAFLSAANGQAVPPQHARASAEPTSHKDPRAIEVDGDTFRVVEEE